MLQFIPAWLTLLTVVAASTVGISPAHSQAAQSTGSPVLVGAGDIANCGPNSNQRQSQDWPTSILLDQVVASHPDAGVFVPGDLAYPAGRTQDFERCYEETWGRHKARTYSVQGNHEYHTPGAAGYFSYFSTAADPMGLGGITAMTIA